MISKSCEAKTPCKTNGGVPRACATISLTKSQGLHL
jgi:hypothetical protein